MGKNGFIGSEYGAAGSTLKLFAIITMLIDHTGAAVVGTIITLGNYRTADYELYGTLSTLYRLMRGIGRLAFPVFCFLLVEGFFHTRSVRKYCERLFLFALISEFPFDFALKPSAVFWNKQNVYFTLLISLICLWMLEEFRAKPCMQLLAIAACMLLADVRRRRSGHLLGELRAAVLHTLLSLQRKTRPEAALHLLLVLPRSPDHPRDPAQIRDPVLDLNR